MKPSLMMLGLVAFTSVTVGCSASAQDQPTTAIASAEPAPDTCDEARFSGTFDFDRVTHEGDSSYCEASASDWNDVERPRTLNFRRNIDGSWSSEYADAPQAGTTDYVLDPVACSLKASSSAKISDKDPQGTSVSIPTSIATTVTLTAGGISVDVRQTHNPASNIQGLPCRITSTTEGLRR